jgi:hypothetical protein
MGHLISWIVYEAAKRMPHPDLELREARQLLGQHLLFPNARITYGQYLRSGERDYDRAVAKVKAGLS